MLNSHIKLLSLLRKNPFVVFQRSNIGTFTQSPDSKYVASNVFLYKKMQRHEKRIGTFSLRKK